MSSYNVLNKKKIFFIIVFSSLLFTNCKRERENVPLSLEINDFVWKGMNTYYLWQDSIPILADNRFSSQEKLYSYLEEYENPSDLFDNLKYRPQDRDKWSWIVDDYLELEAYFSGVRKSSGAKYKLYLTGENSSNIFGVVRYIVPNTDAASKPIQRGDVFYAVNGTSLTTSNYKDLLLNADNFTLNLGDYFYNTTTELVEIVPTGESVVLNKGEYSENPVYKLTTFENTENKVGYLMYNSFTSNYNQELNNAFGYFQNENITDLILDLRYNGGGSVQTANYLCGMITGQFEGDIFTKEQWNPKWQEWLTENHPDWLTNIFTNTMDDGNILNNLNLSRVIVLTTNSSASASELVINALLPYIDVVTIGTTTHGKYVASVTLYDSPDFSRTNGELNPDHKWALQPIVLKEINKNGNYAPEGFEPTLFQNEDINNMGELGTETEPLTSLALYYIDNGVKAFNEKKNIKSHFTLPIQMKLENEMYIEKTLPFQKI